MEKYYDIHNHLFNKNFMAKELLYRLMKELRKFLFAEEARDRGAEPDRGLKNVISTFRRYRYAIKVFMKEDSTAIYRELDKIYKGEFILTPLTFDLTWCFAPSADRDPESREPPVKAVFEKEMNEMFDMVEQRTRSLSRDFNADADEEADALWKEYQVEKELFLQSAGMLGEKHEENVSRQAGNRGVGGIPGFFDGFEEQVKQLIELRNNPAYSGMIFPFLAVDPRRPGIEAYAKTNVGKGKLFAGVKLYCPNGYSPTDPLLFGPDGQRGGIYAFCEDNGIPVTAHNSDGGFATLSKSVIVSGLIHVNGNLVRLDNEKLIFTRSILEKDAVYERAVTLNHPLIWQKVVEKYPNLILNLAHFGGGGQLNAALDNPGDETLWSNRIIGLVKDPRYKVYTDVSCFSDFSTLEKFVNSRTFAEIKPKVLYGSDFILLLLFENDFEENIRQFKALFGSDFDVIASKNPEAFLEKVL